MTHRRDDACMSDYDPYDDYGANDEGWDDGPAVPGGRLYRQEQEDARYYREQDRG